MSKSIKLHSHHPLVEGTMFEKYRCKNKRRAVKFSPEPHEPQEMELKTPWGAVLKVSRGDYIVSELETPDDHWPVAAQIFEDSYEEVAPGIYCKRAITQLAPLTRLVPDANQTVTIETLEGNVTVRAGDFYLARGINDEIWPYPIEDVKSDMELVE